jgi:hypothetical protein
MDETDRSDAGRGEAADEEVTEYVLAVRQYAPM